MSQFEASSCRAMINVFVSQHTAKEENTDGFSVTTNGVKLPSDPGACIGPTVGHSHLLAY